MADRRYRVAGQINREWFVALLEPKTLDQHEQPAEMIAVEVGNDNGVDDVVSEAGSFIGGADGFAAIDEDIRAAEGVEVGGMVAVGDRDAVAGAEAG